MGDATAVSQPPPSLAVVGLACRFPDADDPAGLLEVVLTGRRSFRRLPPGRINLADYYQPDPATSDATYSTRAAVLEGWRFDYASFGVDRAAYLAADPAYWLAMETTARALAAAGLPTSGLDRDRTGVIIGNSLAGDTSRANALRARWPYVRRVLTEALDGAEVSATQADSVLRRAEAGFLTPFPPIGQESLVASTPAAIAAGISNHFGFRGGSHAVDSACSSALQAVASACAALAAGELDAAIAGGVDLSLDPFELIGLAKSGLLAVGDVRIYDQNPTGYLPGEGCGMVVMLRTEDARAAGLPVFAEIVGWGTSSGATAEASDSRSTSQLLAMRRAYERAAVDPRDIQFIEGNGAGTPDDVAELTALSTLREGSGSQAALGSVKANIGHAQAAAGAAALIKTVLALGSGVIPPVTGVRTPHPLITAGDARLGLPGVPQEWPAGIRHASVTSTGIGGSNVHLVLRHEPAGRTRHDRLLRAMPILGRPWARPESEVQPRILTAPEPMPFLFHAADKTALAATLSRLALIAGGLSDAEMQDLACALGRDAVAQGPARVAIVATRQDQLALLAQEATAMLADLPRGTLAVRPGIFASDSAEGKVTLLLSGDLGPARKTDTDQPSATAITAAATRCLHTLRWLDSLDVQAACAVGHGVGALAGLAWAGVLGESDVAEIAESMQAGTADSRPGADQGELRAAIASRFRFGPPRRRLISTSTGAEITSVTDAIDLICSGFGADKVQEAVAAGAAGATLLLEAGTGQELIALARQTGVAAASLQPGVSDPHGRARVAAALFAAGALGQPPPLFAGLSARAIDIWRDREFITNPCEVAPSASSAGSAPASSASISSHRPAIERRMPPRPLIAAVTSQPVQPTETAPTAAAAARRVGAAAIAVPYSQIVGPVGAIAPWVGCFAEELRPVRRLVGIATHRAWRLHAATRDRMLAELSGLFPASPTAERTLAVLGEPSDERSRATAVAAARDAVTTGELVVLTTSSAFTGFFACLHAEHPSIGITIVRLPAEVADAAAIKALAFAEPGRFREVVVSSSGVVSEPVITQLALPGGGDFPLGIDDVVLISRNARGAALALAQVLACCGTPLVVIGRAGRHDDAELVSGLEQLRSAGGRVGYEVIDLADRASLIAAVQRVEDRFGPVTAIGHAATVDDLVPFDDLTDDLVTDAVADEAGILDRLVDSVRPGQLKMILTFGSMAARYGMAGAALAALSRGAVTARATELAAAANCRALHVDVPGWATSGLGDPPALPAQLAAVDATPIEVSAASRVLLKIITSPAPPASLAVHGRAGALTTMQPPAITGAELAAAGLADGAKFLREVSVHYPGTELVCEASLSLASDPYLADYRIDGMHVLPPVLALEALAQAASVLAGAPLRHATSVALDAPIVVPAGGDAELRVCALRTGDTIVTALRCADSSYATDHVRAQFDCGPGQPAMPEPTIATGSAPVGQLVTATSGLVDGAELYGPICFQSGRFRRIALLPEVTARSARALARAGDDEPWSAADGDQASVDFLLGSPGLNDAVLQVLQACVPHRRVRPARCESAHFCGRLADGPVEIRATARATASEPHETTEPASPVGESAPAAVVPTAQDDHVPGTPQLWDIEAVDAAGQLLVTLRGVTLRDCGPLPRNAAWPPALLSVYLERGAADLGFGPDVRVTVFCGQPAGPPSPVLAAAVPQQSPPADSTAPPRRPPRHAARHAVDSPRFWLSAHMRESGHGHGRESGHGPEAAVAAELAPEQRLGLPGVYCATTPPSPAGSALAGFGLTVQAPVPVACGWAVVNAGHPQPPPAGTTHAFATLRSQLTEPPATLTARLEAVSACLSMAGLPADLRLRVTRTTADGWALIDTTQARIVCTVTDISGVSEPVAIAMLIRKHWDDALAVRRAAIEPAEATIP